jgi:glycosyltransferase involved in cell wall biosynthesis
MSQFAKVLIIDQPFNDISGGGITLSNLFKGWPKDKIAVAATGHFLYSVTTGTCDTYYQLGREEHKWKFPLNIVQRTFESGIKTFKPNFNVTSIKHISSLRYMFVNYVFYPFLSWLGLMHISSKIILSERFKAWLAEYSPEVLYLQVFNRETIKFATELIGYLQIPSAIHFMDDWPSTISTKGLFKSYWQRKITRELQLLVDMVNVHLSISGAMADEYKVRYKKEFIAFHNPVDLDNWLPAIKSDYSIDKSKIIILYSGRIGLGIAESLIEVATAIDKINNNLDRIKLHIQTPTEEAGILMSLQQYNCVVINPLVEYAKLPAIMASSDILLLANDFNEKGAAYLKYSMPTKASEYMISGTPVFVYAPEEAAVFQLFSTNNCAYCLCKQSTSEIINAINFLINNEPYRNELAQNSVQYAKEHFDANKVRGDFQRLLNNLSVPNSKI